MKKLILSMIAIAAMASCTTTSEDEFDPNAPVEIKLQSGIEALARGEVKAGTEVTGVQFARLDGTPDWTTIATDAIFTGTIAADNKITFSPVQYYPVDGTTNANIVGFYPEATSITKGVASMTIDGTDDVIYASPVAGSKGTPIKDNMSFNHKLTQFKFVIQRDAASTNADITGVSIKINNANTKFTLALADGTLNNWETPISTLNPIQNGKATTTPSTPSGELMLQPDMTSISLQVEAEGYTSSVITVAGTDNGKFEAGKSYKIILTFKGTSITPSATIGVWGQGTDGKEDVQ